MEISTFLIIAVIVIVIMVGQILSSLFRDRDALKKVRKIGVQLIFNENKGVAAFCRHRDFLVSRAAWEIMVRDASKKNLGVLMETPMIVVSQTFTFYSGPSEKAPLACTGTISDFEVILDRLVLGITGHRLSEFDSLTQSRIRNILCERRESLFVPFSGTKMPGSTDPHEQVKMFRKTLEEAETTLLS